MVVHINVDMIVKERPRNMGLMFVTKFAQKKDAVISITISM